MRMKDEFINDKLSNKIVSVRANVLRFVKIHTSSRNNVYFRTQESKMIESIYARVIHKFMTCVD